MTSQSLRTVGLLMGSLLFCLTSMGQKQFTLEELNYGGTSYRQYVPENIYTAWWGETLVKLDAEECAIIDTKTAKQNTLFTLQEVNTWARLDENEKVRSLYYAEFPYPNQTVVLLRTKKERLLLNFNTHKVEWRQSTAGETHADWNLKSRNVAYVKDNQLCVTTAEGKLIKVTNDGSRNIVYAQSVHRNEFGIEKGTFWSPDGQQLAFYRMDQSDVADYPQVDIFNRIAQYEPDKYPMAGETSHKVQVGVLNILTEDTVYLKTGDPTDRYFTNIAWAPDGKTIYMFELNRDQNHCELVQYNAANGERIKVLYEETDSKYVEPLHPIVFLPWNNKQFILQSQRDGFNHLYLYNTDGTLVKQLTKGDFVDIDFLGFNTEKQSVVVLSNESSPIQANLYSVNVKTGKKMLIDNGKGWHSGELSANGTLVLNRWQEPDVPRCIDVINTASGKCSVHLLTAKDPWEEFSVPDYSTGSIKAADGVTDLYYRMVKPIGFKPTEKYPTIIYVYGGPHAHNVDARWHYGSRSWETYMAQKGYILFILDNRGSEHRGKAFEQATFRELGQQEMADQMCGVEFLKSLPYVDSDRMGVHGWSFGGFMTITLMVNHPEIFKVGVAGGPVIDWKYYEVMYGERYMDTPQDNPEGYAKTSLLNRAKDLKGKLQIITGYNDETVVPQNCLDFIAKCIQNGTQPDFFVYPGEPHNMRGHQSVHLHERITDYFETYLK